MTVQILPAALDDLDKIDLYVTENFGPSVAARTIARLFDTFQLLADFPGIGRPRQDVTKRSVRFFLAKPYWILYEPGDSLVIQRVYHAARDLKRLPKIELPY